MELAERARMFAALGDVTRLALLDELAHGDLTPRALADALGTPGNLLTHHLGILQDSGLVRKRRSDVDALRRAKRFNAAADLLKTFDDPEIGADLQVDAREQMRRDDYFKEVQGL